MVRTFVTLSLVVVLALCISPTTSAQCGAVASVAVVGTGSPGSNGVPLLSANGAPLIGVPGFQLTLSNGALNGSGGIMVSTLAGNMVFPNLGATLYLGFPIHHFRLQLDAQGSAALGVPQVVTMPDLYCGLTVHAQGLVLDPAAQGGFALSNALTITFGS
jgi:hypothetical protein